MLVVIGVDEHGKKDGLAIEDGFRENVDSWRDLLEGAQEPESSRAAGTDHWRRALGFWTVLRDVYPDPCEQRRWVHKTSNVLGAMAKSVHERAKADLQDISVAQTRDKAKAAFDLFVATYGVKYEKAAAKLVKDRDELLIFYGFPTEPFRHIRTANPIESVFATVRNRTRKTVPCVVFRLMMSARKKWRRISKLNRLPEVIQGVDFKDGMKQLQAIA